MEGGWVNFPFISHVPPTLPRNIWPSSGRKKCRGSTACIMPGQEYRSWICDVISHSRHTDWQDWQHVKLFIRKGLSLELQSELACQRTGGGGGRAPPPEPSTNSLNWLFRLIFIFVLVTILDWYQSTILVQPPPPLSWNPCSSDTLTSLQRNENAEFANISASIAARPAIWGLPVPHDSLLVTPPWWVHVFRHTTLVLA